MTGEHTDKSKLEKPVGHIRKIESYRQKFVEIVFFVSD